MESPLISASNAHGAGKICDFRQIIHYISKTVQDRKMNRKLYALCRMVTLPMTLSDLTTRNHPYSYVSGLENLQILCTCRPYQLLALGWQTTADWLWCDQKA